MSFATQKANLAAQLVIFRTKILALFAQPVTTANTADNANTLNGQTVTQIKQPVVDALAAHLAEVNPHKVHATSLESLTIAQTQEIFSVKSNQGELPVTGIKINGDIKIVASKIVIPAGSIAFISGTGELLAVDKQFDLPGVIGGGVYYLYLTLSGGTWKFAYFDTKIPESENSMYVTSHVISNTTNFTVPNTNNITVRRLDLYRLSTTNVGGAFIATKSDPAQPVSNIWS